MIQFWVIVLLTTALGGSIKIDIVSLNGLNFIQHGGNVHLNCSFSSSEASTTAWFKQTPGEKPLLIASAYHFNPVRYGNDFQKHGRIIALRGKNSFTLGISSAEPSDSATYFCSVSYNTENALADWTILVIKGEPSSLYTVLQHPISDPVQLGGDTTLQCSILTDNSAEDHSVYWFRHGSGESDPGIIFTHGNRSDQCKKSSETASPTQSCVYKLPKNNLSLSDAGTYYCAVAACGHIIFGNGTKLDIREFSENSLFVTAVIASVILNIICIIFMCRKLHSSHCKDAGEDQVLQVNQDVCDEDLNYAALSFTEKPPTTKGTRRQHCDTVYARVKLSQ